MQIIVKNPSFKPYNSYIIYSIDNQTSGQQTQHVDYLESQH